MRVVCVYREGEDYSRTVDEWLEGFYRQTGRRLEIINPDMETGFCEAYDVVEYPTILALDDMGAVQGAWRGRELPLFDEVLYYMV